ncbi:MAG: glycosyltransferase family 2 protein [Campylobacterota bacterium]|nr:glycosyltransferase family 2 protein [Campylobacterota bacterium]
MSQSETIVVIPTYDNPLTINSVAFDILKYDYSVIIVDDGSSTPVEKLLSQEESENIVFLRHETNQGKGQAIITGTQKAKELGFSHIVSMDGDGQHLASQIATLVEDYQEDEIVIGARNFDIDNIPMGSKIGRWFSNFWACWDTGYTITDSLSGFRVYPVSILDLPIKTKRFDWEMEVLVRHADAGKSIKEVEIQCHYPLQEERVSHFRNFEDTMTIVWVHIQILPFKWPGMLWRKLLPGKQ